MKMKNARVHITCAQGIFLKSFKVYFRILFEFYNSISPAFLRAIFVIPGPMSS